MRYDYRKDTENLICDSMEDIRILPQTEKEDILQCLKTIVLTNAGSCPMCRDVGISGDPLHRRTGTAKILLTRDIFVAVQDQEPRADVTEVNYHDTEISIIEPVLEVKLNG